MKVYDRKTEGTNIQGRPLAQWIKRVNEYCTELLTGKRSNVWKGST